MGPTSRNASSRAFVAAMAGFALGTIAWNTGVITGVLGLWLIGEIDGLLVRLLILAAPYLAYGFVVTTLSLRLVGRDHTTDALIASGIAFGAWLAILATIFVSTQDTELRWFAVFSLVMTIVAGVPGAFAAWLLGRGGHLARLVPSEQDMQGWHPDDAPDEHKAPGRAARLAIAGLCALVFGGGVALVAVGIA